jgi:Fe-S-cluster-containing dehydrogenase component
MTQYALLVDLQKCVSCGACAIACKTENNTAIRRNGQTHNFADFIFRTEGVFPNLKHTTLPVMCNHCSNAPCVEECPVEPKAMFKTPEGTTMHNDERCIGCLACQDACPYSLSEVTKDGEYSVISYNEAKQPYEAFYHDGTEVIPGCTSSGIDTARAARANPPHRTKFDHPDYEDVRRADIVEKCILCEHRVKNGLLPYCVVSCTARARVFGDREDPKSEVSKLLEKYEHFVLKPEEGTKPNVYYIRKYSVKA